MTVEIDIAVECESWAELEDLDGLVRAAIDAALTESGVDLRTEPEVSLLFCDDARIRELNRQWRSIDKPTNVLSFPAADPSQLRTTPLLGDIAVAYETVRRESLDEGKAFRDHVSHMVVHGFLHLVGYDHQKEEEALQMEDLERRSLARLGIADPYAATVPVGGEQR